MCYNVQTKRNNRERYTKHKGRMYDEEIGNMPSVILSFVLIKIVPFLLVDIYYYITYGNKFNIVP